MRKASHFAGAMAFTGLALLTAGAVHADDTEVFLSRSAPTGLDRPNVLFIIDNSGSMDALVETQVPWNADSTYTGCYRSDALYYATGTQPPPCGSPAFILKSGNRCAASNASLRALGLYRGLLRSWDAERERWRLLTESESEDPLECAADRGIDGNGGGSESFAANGPDGPWDDDPAQEPAWAMAYTVFDGNWLNWRNNPPTETRTRLEIIQHAVNALLDSLDGVNVGLMRFNAERGGTVVQAITDIDISRDQMKSAVDAITPYGFTPLSETLYEAALYLRGGTVDFGNVGPVPSVAASRTGNDPASAQYLSPLTGSCQKNFIILLTDGEPTRDDEANAKITALPGFPSLVGSCDGSGDGACLDDLAEYLYLGDARAALDRRQSIVTYTIGFDVDFPLLAATARRGGGRYHVASDTASLTAALTDVVNGVTGSTGLFATPTIPVGYFGQTASQRDVYVSVFEPTITARWPGNLKKYAFAEGRLLDADGNDAVDPDTGYFRSDARSFWSADPDGDRAAEGGAASRLPATADRSMFTDISGPELTATANRVEVDNTAITAALLGVATDQRDALVNWITGADVADIDGDGDSSEPRLQMSDPLHVRPVTLSYGTSAEDPDTVVFVSTNAGLLQAVDADTGVEIWSYLPERMLSRQYDLFLDRETPGRSYGLDGELKLFSGIMADDSRRNILLFGLGRGGDAIYALDVTDRNEPVLLWQIDSSTSGFTNLGQTWSAPVVTRVDIDGEQLPVVILSGGYDDSQDNRGFHTDTAGNALYMIDLATGEPLWSAGAPDAGHDLELDQMLFSIPAAPRVIDLGGDGLADRMYVGDMGGQLWRFDILNGEPREDLVAGGVLASLGAAATDAPEAADVRRFYATPDVVFVNCNRGNFLAINLGSGYRGHPLDTDVEDAFFSVRDPNVYLPIATDAYPEQPPGVADLVDITTDPAAVLPADAAGWRLRMVEDPGEKILSGAITLNQVTFFTSFAPGNNVSACEGGTGVNRTYQVGTCNGWPINNLDGETEPGPLGVEDRVRKLSQTGIAPEILFLSTDYAASGMLGCVGLECFETPAGSGAGRLPRTFWSTETRR